MSHFAKYVGSLAVFGEGRRHEVRWLFDSLINSLVIAERNADVCRVNSAASSLRHAKNLLRFLNRCMADLPDQKLVTHLDEFFAMLDRSIDQSIQLPISEDLEELRLLVSELQRGWDMLLAPTTSAPDAAPSSHQLLAR